MKLGKQPYEMEAAATSPSMALGLISEGKEQVVEIDHKMILSKVMQALAAKELPSFKIIQCAEQAVKVAIKLDVSGAKYSLGQNVTTTLVEGDTHTSKSLAEKSVVLNALQYLSDQHLIKVRDYSSSVINSLEQDRIFGDVNAALYSVEKLLGHWDVNIGQCKQMALNLEGKGSEQTGDRQIYQSLSEFTSLVLASFNKKLGTTKSVATKLEFARKKYQNRSTEKYHANLRKGHVHDVVVTAKEVLDYVLTYLGAGQAKYSNGPTEYGLMKAVVTFNVPCVKGIDYCGNLTIKGKSMRSMDAEGDAAFRALQFMENKYSLRIVDLNYDERVQCEDERKLLVRLLEQKIDVGNDVKRYWAKMIAAINTEHHDHCVDPTAIFLGKNACKQIEAHTFCARELDHLAKVSNKSYVDCSSSFDGLQEIEHKMQEMKASLRMD